jgi:hypothetical protein
MFRRYTGLRAGEVRERGGLNCVLSVLTRELAQCASSSRTSEASDAPAG